MDIANILGFSVKGSHGSAHETHFGTIAYNEQGQGHHFIFKKNKHLGRMGAQASELEAAFTAVANVYVAAKHALRQEIVRNQHGKIIGVCSEHAAHALLRLKKANPELKFLQANYSLNPDEDVGDEEFQQWLLSHKEISLLSPPEAEEPLEQHPLFESNADFSLTEEEEKKQERLEHLRAAYQTRLNNYWHERKALGVLPELEGVDLQRCLNYCGEFASLEEILQRQPLPYPQKLIEAVFHWNDLKQQCEAQAENNLGQEAEIAALGVGQGFNFLDKLPQNFFSKLLAAKNQGLASVDMESLADVFGTAYGLEEDDLHKGNIGYYVTQEHGRPCFHFFKIDHDLMFSDKVMSARGAARFANLSYTEKKFRVTPRDLLNFPDLLDSGNHYWPTKRVIFAKGNKAYQSKEDREAYKSLKDDPDFQKAKWHRFLKQVVVPNELIVKSLQMPLEHTGTDPESASTLAVVQRATASRIAELKLALISLPEFRRYLAQHSQQAIASIRTEVTQYARDLGCSEEEIAHYHFEVREAISQMMSSAIVGKSSTAPYAAIKIQSYRCYETDKYLNESLHSKDKSGRTVLDRVMADYNTFTTALLFPNLPEERRNYCMKMRTYYADVIGDLHRCHAAHSFDEETYQKMIDEVKKQDTLAQLPVVTSLNDFKMQLQTIRSQPLHSLKQDKVCAVELLRKADLSAEDLMQLQKELRPVEPAAPLKFIKELRSEIWIIRKIRGAYGSTQTYQDMNHLISHKLLELEKQHGVQEEGHGLGSVNLP